MKLKTLLLAGATALFSQAAFADVQDVINAVVSDLSGKGFTRFEVQPTLGGVKVHATGPAGEIERLYDRQGGLLREEVSNSSYDDNNGSDDNGSDDNGSDDDSDDDHGGRSSGSDDDSSDDDHGSNHDSGGNHDSGSDDDGGDDHDDDGGDHEGGRNSGKRH